MYEQTNNKLTLNIILGDITQTPTDAIMTAINSGGMWYGGVDGAIQRAAGDQYHSQAADKMPLNDLDTIVAKGDRNKHNGQFNDVVFVVDDLESPLNEIVYKGLEAAHNEGYESLAIPAVRMGVMKGVVEKTSEETVNKIVEGIKQFVDKYGKNTNLTELTFVIYNDMETVNDLRYGFKSQHLFNS